MKSNIQKKRVRILTGLLILCIVLCIILYFYLGYSGFDLKGHWRIGRYTLLGYDPFPLIGQHAFLESIGKIPEGFSTVPWCCVFGSIFYGAFLPIGIAQIYIWILHFVIYAVTALVICRKFRRYFSSKFILLLILLIGGHFSFMYSLRYGNAGAILCCLVILAVCLTDTNPWIAGICMGFAMMKPQISMIICLVWLFNRKWKPLFTAATIDILGWITTSVITHTSPLLLLKETLSSGMASSKQYLGMFSFLQLAGMDSTAVLLLNMIIGIIFTAGGWFYLKNKCQATDNSLVLYVPACASSTFWMYKNGTDYLILVFVAAFFLWLCFETNLSAKDFWLSAFCLLYLEMSRCAVYFAIILGGKSETVRNLAKSFDGILIAVVTVIFLRLWRTYRRQNCY